LRNEELQNVYSLTGITGMAEVGWDERDM